MNIDNIVQWCDKHTQLATLLKNNFDTFISQEIPSVNESVTDIRIVHANTSCVTSLLDKYMFILAMISPTSIYNLIVDKIANLKQVANNYIALKYSNNTQMQYILDSLDDKFIHQYLK